MLKAKMLRADAHVHLCDRRLAGVPALDRPHLPDDLRWVQPLVDMWVYVEVNSHDPLDEMRWVNHLAARTLQLRSIAAGCCRRAMRPSAATCWVTSASTRGCSAWATCSMTPA